MSPEVPKTPIKKLRFHERLSQWKLIFQQCPKVIRLAWRAWPLGIAILPVLTITAGILPALSVYCLLKKVIDGVSLWTSGKDVAAGKEMIFLFLSPDHAMFLFVSELPQLIIQILTLGQPGTRKVMERAVMQVGLVMLSTFPGFKVLMCAVVLWLLGKTSVKAD